MRKQLYTITFLFLCTITTFAQQQELSTLLIPNTWQANRLNPSIVPKAKFVIGGPGVYNNIRTTNIVYDDLFATNDRGETVLQVNSAIEKLEDQNLVIENLKTETLSFGVNLGDFWITLGHSINSNILLDYPKTLPQLIWQGNAQFIGQTISFGPEQDLNTYHEIGLGLVFEVRPGFTIGGRLKYLSGVNSIISTKSQMELTTDDDIYQLTMDADYHVNSSGSLQYDGWTDLDVSFNFGYLTFDNIFGPNTGTAFDLGANLQVGKFSIAASAIDLGAGINWKDDVRNYSLNGTYEYVGLDLAENILDNDQELGSVIDTLKAIYDPLETFDPYTTQLPSRYYLNAGYQLNDTWHFGALFHYENNNYGLSGPAFAFGANAQVIPALNIGTSIAYRQESFSNVGLNINLFLGPARILLATDNIFTAFNPESSHTSNVRLGTSVLLSRKKTMDEIENQDGFFK